MSYYQCSGCGERFDHRCPDGPECRLKHPCTTCGAEVVIPSLAERMLRDISGLVGYNNESVRERQLAIIETYLEADARDLRRLREIERQILHTLSRCPKAVRVREGGGPEDIAASVTVTLSAFGALK